MRIPSFSNISFRMRRGDEILMYLLGLFSSWQILQFAGFSLSTLLTVFTAGYLILTHGFSSFRKDWLLIAMPLSIIATFAVSMIASLPAGYIKASVSGTLQWGFIFIICIYMRQSSDTRCTSSFFRGLDLSCKVQIFWCLLQVVAYYALKLDINAKLFGELLHMNNETSQYRHGVLVCTGLHWHAANMIPVLVYLYFRYPKLLWKGLCLLVMYFTKNATAIIALGMSVCLDILHFFLKTIRQNNASVAQKILAWVMAGICLTSLAMPLIFPKIKEMIEYLLLRLYQINNPSYGNESSAVHFNYYRLLPQILIGISPLCALFGSGIGTSGHWFSVFENQYPDAIWIVESDPVNIILSQGLLGATLHYLFIFYCIWQLFRRQQNYRAFFLLVLFICGFVYNNQLLWVLLVELMMYCQARSPQSIR